MLSSQTWKYLGIITCAVTGIILLGITSGFGISIGTNLFNTGLNINILLGLLQIGAAIAIYNNYL
jgi:hypothetical protein